MTQETPLFAALLKYWRGRRGWSQLDLSLAAEISTRHVSFLENGRSRPSEAMVCTLGAALDVPLRDQNEMLRAAGFLDIFAEPELDGLEDPGIARAIERMMLQHEPYPMVLMTAAYDILRVNQGAQRLFSLAMPGSPVGHNAIELMFAQARPMISNWDATAREMTARLHRECLHRPEDGRLGEVLEGILEDPDVPKTWRQPDFSKRASATFRIGFEFGDARLSFLTTITTFSAPQNVTLDELIIESYFPLDDATEAMCAALVET